MYQWEFTVRTKFFVAILKFITAQDTSRHFMPEAKANFTVKTDILRKINI